MGDEIRKKIDTLLEKYYSDAKIKHKHDEIVLNFYIETVKKFPFVKKLIRENTRLKLENSRLKAENNELTSSYCSENINLEINEKDESSNELSSDSEEIENVQETEDGGGNNECSNNN